MAEKLIPHYPGHVDLSRAWASPTSWCAPRVLRGSKLARSLAWTLAGRLELSGRTPRGLSASAPHRLCVVSTHADRSAVRPWIRTKRRAPPQRPRCGGGCGCFRRGTGKRAGDSKSSVRALALVSGQLPGARLDRRPGRRRTDLGRSPPLGVSIASIHGWVDPRQVAPALIRSAYSCIVPTSLTEHTRRRCRTRFSITVGRASRHRDDGEALPPRGKKKNCGVQRLAVCRLQGHRTRRDGRGASRIDGSVRPRASGLAVRRAVLAGNNLGEGERD